MYQHEQAPNHYRLNILYREANLVGITSNAGRLTPNMLVCFPTHKAMLTAKRAFEETYACTLPESPTEDIVDFHGFWLPRVIKLADPENPAQSEIIVTHESEFLSKQIRLARVPSFATSEMDTFVDTLQKAMDTVSSSKKSAFYGHAAN